MRSLPQKSSLRWGHLPSIRIHSAALYLGLTMHRGWPFSTVTGPREESKEKRRGMHGFRGIWTDYGVAAHFAPMVRDGIQIPRLSSVEANDSLHRLYVGHRGRTGVWLARLHQPSSTTMARARGASDSAIDPKATR